MYFVITYQKNINLKKNTRFFSCLIVDIMSKVDHTKKHTTVRKKSKKGSPPPPPPPSQKK